MADYTFNATLSLDGESAAIVAQSGQASADIPLVGKKANKVIVRVYNGDGNTATITFGAGGADGILSDKGVITDTMLTTEVKYYGPFEASRVLDSTNDLLLTIAGAGVTASNVKLEILYING